MTTQNTPRKKTLASAIAGAMDIQSMNFSGFDDWFEIFEGGVQTDSQGKTKEFTQAHLDSVVTNHVPAPLVVGHPKTNDPAFGWSTELKREGNKLFAKAGDVASEFESAVKNKHFPKRSVSLIPDGNGGYKLRHIGFLGAAAPAVEGLKDLEFSADESAEVYEFRAPETAHQVRWGFDTIGRIFRSLRDRLIETDGKEAADQIIPDYQVTEIQNISSQLVEDRSHHFSQPADPATDSAKSGNPPEKPTDNKEVTPMSDFSQADIDAAVEKERKKTQAAQKQLSAMQFSAQVQSANELIQTALKEGRLLPVQVEGMAEFMAQLSTIEGTFEFSAPGSDDTKKQTPLEFMQNLIGTLTVQVKPGEDDSEEPGSAKNYNAPSGFTVNQERADLHQKAMDYSAKHGVDYVTAVTRLEQE